MNAVLTNPRCERCGCEASKIPGCQGRSTGICPFVEQWKRRNGWLVWIGGFLALFLLPVFNSNGYWSFILWVILSLGGLLTQEVQLYNERTQTRLQRTALAGIELSYKWTPKGKLLPIQFDWSKTAVYPFSISALPVQSTRYRASMELAVAVFRAALIGLLADNFIEVHLYQTMIFRKWQPSPEPINEYIITAKKENPLPADAGSLERQIIKAFEKGQIKSGRKEWQEGLPIHELVHNIYDSDVSNSPGWLIKCATIDAEGRGMAKFRKGFYWTSIDWDTTCAAQLQQEHRATQALSQQLAEGFSEFSILLDNQVRRGIESREESSD
jgi:hypothetical protein